MNEQIKQQKQYVAEIIEINEENYYHGIFINETGGITVSEIKPCNCGNSKLRIMKENGLSQVMCVSCKCSTGRWGSEKQAIKAWNKKINHE
jgi:hypothetical protein